MLNVGGIEYVYVPNGSYIETDNPVLNPDIALPSFTGVTYTGVSVVPLSTTGGTKTQIDTPDSVNSCASNPTTGVVVCTSNHQDIYIIDSATNTITTTLQSSGDPNFPFFSSGGACVTCGVTVNAANNTAVIGVSADPANSAGQSAYQILDLATDTLGSVFYVSGNHIAESWSMDTDRNLLLSPTEEVAPNQPDFNGVGGNGPWNLTQTAQFSLFDLGLSSPAQYDYTPASTTFEPMTELDSVAQDVTGITVASAEFTGNLLLNDLSQKTTSAGNPGGWTSPNQLQNLPELGPDSVTNYNWVFPGPLPDFFLSGATALSIATGTHYGFMADEWGNRAIGAFHLPDASSTTGAPQIVDYVFASLPNDPATNGPWENPFDPHGLASAYTTIGTGNAYGVLMGTTYNAAQATVDASSDGVTSAIPYTRGSIAVVSLPGLLAAPRVSDCTSTTIPIYSLTESGNTVTVVTGIVDGTGNVSPHAHGFSVGDTVVIGDFYNGFAEDPSGSLAYNGSFVITSVPDPTSFTVTNSVASLGQAISGQGLFGGANATRYQCTSDYGGHFVDPTYDLVGNGVVRFFPSH